MEVRSLGHGAEEEVTLHDGWGAVKKPLRGGCSGAEA